jgi:hypothetical protein
MEAYRTFLLVLGVVGVVVGAPSPRQTIADALPTVDVGYAVYEATLNVSYSP